jgi:sugar lactone lactonase YvrE
MRSKIVTSCLVSLLFLVFISANIFAQDFVRHATIPPVPVPEPGLNVGGLGNMVTDVDFDNDGRIDVYVVNDNWNDVPSELVPRLYKYEYNGAAWEIVWACSLTTLYGQNTWPALTTGDLDNDGKMEIIWGPTNFLDATNNPNPNRIFVFEQTTVGSEDFGIQDGNNYLPNSQWTITDQAMTEIRPIRFLVEDVDADGINEVLFADRNGGGGWYFGVISVDDIPDAGGGSETWTVEANGLTVGLSGIPAQYDLAFQDSTLYLFNDALTRVKWNGATWDLLTTQQNNSLAELGSWKSAQAYDFDTNAKKEIIVGSWNNTANATNSHGVWICQSWDPTGATDTRLDTLYCTKIADLSAHMPAGSYGVYGGTIGDIDLNGHMDYVFGSRDLSPNAKIFRLEYWGEPNHVGEAANWRLSVIDSNYTVSSGRWDVFDFANIDDDPNLEVFYTTGTPAGTTQPIVILDNTLEIPIGPWQKVEAPYVFLEDFKTGLPGSPHGIACDKYGRVWMGEYGSAGALRIYNADGTEAAFSPITSVTIPNPPNADTTLALAYCTGLGLDIDGNILYVRSVGSKLIKIDVETGQGLDWVELGGSPLAPAIDDQGFIYVGYVVGVDPIQVIDPATFEITQLIELEDEPDYARGMAVSLDGLTLLPGDLDGGVHDIPIYTSTDWVTYTKTDSLNTDNQGNPIFTIQTVTVDTKPEEGTIWYSMDNSYGTGGDDQLNNAMGIFNFDTYEYSVLYMPPPATSTSKTGPRGCAFSPSGDTVYVSNYNGQGIYRYIHESLVGVAKDGAQTPMQFKLAQNYPNPFNPVTTIEFTIGKAGKTNLVVYNMLGQKVVTLINQNLPRGTFKVTFDGSNYASGAYVYVLKSDGKILNKKMMLVK